MDETDGRGTIRDEPLGNQKYMGHHAGEGDTNGGDQTEEDVKLPKTADNAAQQQSQSQDQTPIRDDCFGAETVKKIADKRAKESHPRQERRKTPRPCRRGSSRRRRARRRKKLRMKNEDRG